MQVDTLRKEIRDRHKQLIKLVEHGDAVQFYKEIILFVNWLNTIDVFKKPLKDLDEPKVEYQKTYNIPEERDERQFEDTVFGAWGLMKQLSTVSSGGTNYSELKAWSRYFSQDMYLVYLNRIVNYLIEKIYEQDQVITKKYRDIKIVKVFEEGEKGMVELSNGDKRSIGSANGRPYRLLSYVFNIGMDIEVSLGGVFEAIRLPTDKDKYPELLSSNTYESSRKRIIGYAIKELQNSGVLKGLIGMKTYKDNNRSRLVSFH